MFASCVQLLVDNGFIGFQGLVNLIFLSWEVHNATLLDDGVWESLCNHEFPNTRSIPKELRQARGHLWLYLKWKSRVPREPLPSSLGPMPPPSCTADDIKLFVSLKHKEATFIDLVVDGERLVELLERHETTYEFQEPKVLGKAAWLNLKLHRVWLHDPNDNQAIDCSVSIHLFRYNDSSISCVLDCPTNEGGHCGDELYVYPKLNPGEVFTENTEFDLSRGQRTQYFCFSPWIFGDVGLVLRKGCPLRQTALAVEIKKRLSDRPVVFEIYCKLAVVNGGLFAITSLTIKAVQLLPFDHDVDEAGTVRFFADHGVTLLHILSEIE